MFYLYVLLGVLLTYFTYIQVGKAFFVLFVVMYIIEIKTTGIAIKNTNDNLGLNEKAIIIPPFCVKL